jgi:hypothetical protein
LFATNTAVALDISANATTSAPNITIGYKRQEMAWVPLLANQKGRHDEREPAECPKSNVGGKDDPCVFRGLDGESADAYSVLATFSGTAAASGSAGTGTPKTEASGKIAQFFATGMAARLLAEHGGAQLVNSGAAPPDDAAQIIVTFEKQRQTDAQALTDYLASAGSFDQARNALVENAGFPPGTVATLEAPTDPNAFLDLVQKNFATHPLAKAIPKAKAALAAAGGGGAAAPVPAAPAAPSPAPAVPVAPPPVPPTN